MIERGRGAKSGNLTLIQTEINGADMKTPLTKEKILEMTLPELFQICPIPKKITKQINSRVFRFRDFVLLRSAYILILNGIFLKRITPHSITWNGGTIFSAGKSEASKWENLDLP